MPQAVFAIFLVHINQMNRIRNGIQRPTEPVLVRCGIGSQYIADIQILRFHFQQGCDGVNKMNMAVTAVPFSRPKLKPFFQLNFYRIYPGRNMDYTIKQVISISFNYLEPDICWRKAYFTSTIYVSKFPVVIEYYISSTFIKFQINLMCNRRIIN